MNLVTILACNPSVSDANVELFVATAEVLLYCWIFGFVLLLAWFGMFRLSSIGMIQSLLNKTGLYKGRGQFKREGRVQVIPFVLKVN